MTDTPRPAPDAGDDPLRAAHLDHPVLELVTSWLRRSRETASARVEAALDRGSFESFPASDPVAPAAATGERRPTVEDVDCTMRPQELVFRVSTREPDPARAPPAWTAEGASADGRRIRLRVWVEDAGPGQAVPATLELEPVHASLRARRHERRAGADRRVAPRSLPAGFDRRVAERRGRVEADALAPG